MNYRAHYLPRSLAKLSVHALELSTSLVSVSDRWRKHAQRRWPHAIMKRRLHDGYFAIERHTDTLASCSDPNVFCGKGQEISFLTKAAE
jgi:hypothetical protein